MSPFADLEVKFNSNNNEPKFKKTEFMQMGQGAHTVRILQSQAKTFPTHFFLTNKTSVLCLGDECPICQNNKNLFRQFGKEANKQQGFNSVNYRFFVNVLDKTPAKVGSDGKEYKDLRLTISPSNGEVLPEAKPLNKVKVLSKGLKLRDELDSIDRAILDNTGTPIGLVNYDMVLMVSGTGKDTKTTPVPRTEANEPVPEGLELFDLEKCVIKVTAEEMLDLQRGIGLKDIFAARKNKEVSFEPVASQEALDDVNDRVNKLFEQ